ncbi:sensory rhodopsin transducer [Pusillimonas sp.]
MATEGYIPADSTNGDDSVVQHTRLDSRQLALALLSTVAYPND